MHSVCSPVFAGRQVQVRSTPKPITPFGGLVSLISFFELKESGHLAHIFNPGRALRASLLEETEDIETEDRRQKMKMSLLQ
jgi:hypothetical protein